MRVGFTIRTIINHKLGFIFSHLSINFKGSHAYVLTSSKFEKLNQTSVEIWT